MEGRKAHGQAGQGLVEYSLILVLIAVVASVALGAIGDEFTVSGYIGTHLSSLATTLGT